MTVVAIAGNGGTTVTTIESRRPAPVPAAANGALGAAQVYAQAKDSVASISARSAILPATVVGRDESTDLALLRVRGADASLRPLPLADSGALQVGDATYAIGSPFGLASTLTSGVVSALGRSIDAPNGFSIDHVIQTDAPINPGNSGGPLLDDHGRVIGVNSQILTATGSSQSGNVGIGFAIPSSTVRAIVAQLEASGHVAHPWLGVQLAASESGRGAQVAALAGGGPAQQAGLRAVN